MQRGKREVTGCSTLGKSSTRFTYARKGFDPVRPSSSALV